MTPSELEIRKKLKENFPHYAAKCLKIRTKSGSIEPFVLNKAQKHIHALLETQKALTGKVRAIILKGRQQGCCLAEHTRVLLSNMTWVFIKDIRIGDELIACDEDASIINDKSPKKSRKFKTAVVEHVQVFTKFTWEIAFDNGVKLDVTPDHRLLCKKYGHELQWVHVQDFQLGDKIQVAVRAPNDTAKATKLKISNNDVNEKWYEDQELPLRCWAKVIGIRPLEKKHVVDIQTSTKTFICEGLVSHNSTYVGGRFYHKVTHSFGMQAFILTHALDATQNLYKMAQRYYDGTPAPVKPEVTTSNAKELIFGLLDSGYKLGTAENKAVGRSATVQLLHGSECAFWNNAAEHAKGIMQAVPNTANTEIILESTANGVGNYFHQQWQAAEAEVSEFIAIFIPWFWQDEYFKPTLDDFLLTAEEEDLRDAFLLTNEQLNWRRNKIIELSVNGQDGEKAFKQEYPCTPHEAFILTGEDSFISSDIVTKARSAVAEKYGKLIVGVDPARFGDDRTSIIRRQGRVAYNLQSYTKKDTMQVVGYVNKIIEEEAPYKVFIDVGGLGAGVVDRLFELGHREIVVAVNAGSSPLDSKKYSNKRAEMWGECKSWLHEQPCNIPDSNSLQADLCGVKYSIDSNSRLKIEKKEDMKKRGIRSSDEADALCLTFAYPQRLYESDSKNNEIASRMMQKQKSIRTIRTFYNEQQG